LHGGLANPYNIPLGGLLPYVGASAPNSAFALPFGQTISRSTYATLFALIGTTFGSGDGSSTFHLPDIRGRVIAGLDNMGGPNASRLSSVLSSTSMGAAAGAQSQAIAQANLPNFSFPVADNHRHHAIAGDEGYGAIQSFTSNVFPHDGPGTAFNVPDWNSRFTINGNVGAYLTGLTVSGAISVSSGGSGTPLTTTQPTIVTNYILRII
jgi:microcystin-dependent protein